MRRSKLAVLLSTVFITAFAGFWFADRPDRNDGVREPGAPEDFTYPDARAEEIHTNWKPTSGPEVMVYFLSKVNWPYGPGLPASILQSIIDAEKKRPDEDDQQGKRLLEPWTYVGSRGMPVRGRSGRYSGRLRDIRRMPDGNLRVLAANGGLWEENSGTWTAIGDSLEVTAMGSFDFDSQHPDTILVGTGDPVDSSRNGLGLYRTLDGGISWTKTAPASMGQNYWKLRYAPDFWEDGIAFAATNLGFLKSEDGGASWVKKAPGICTSFDCAYDPFAPTERVMYAGFAGRADMSTLPPEFPRGGLFRSEDAGETWTRLLSTELPDTNVIHRVSVEVCRTQPENVWALFSIIQSDGRVEVDRLARSSDAGASWTNISIPGGIDDRQGGYNHLLAVHPADPNRVFIGGRKLHYTPSGGAFTGELDVHDDQHCALWVGGDEIFVGNDGGLWHSTDSGNSWSSAKNSLPITQYTDISVCFTDPNFVAGGSQDNGLSMTMDLDNWEVIEPGDGGGLAMQPANCALSVTVDGYFSMGSNFQRRKSDNSFGSLSGFDDGIAENGTWYPPVRWPRFTGTIYTAAEKTVYTTGGFSESWVPLNMTPFANTVLELAVDEFGEAVYVTLNKTTQGGRIWVYRDGTWVDRDLGLPNNALIRRVKPHPTLGHRGVAYLICGNADQVGSQVWRTENFGAIWNNISETMDACVPTDVTGHPDDLNQIYVSHTRGMLWTPNNGTNWLDANTNMPEAIDITNLYVVPDPDGAPGEHWLYAGTYGRGIWRRKITAPPAGPPDPIATYVKSYGTAALGGARFLAHPDGSGETMASKIAGIAVQVMDSNLVPVAGMAANRITLRSDPDSATVECEPVIADATTDRAGWTSFSGAFPWGGFTTKLKVYIDGVPINGEESIDVVSSDISMDKRVDIADLLLFTDDTAFDTERSDFNHDGVVDDGDVTILQGAILEPKSCPFEPPIMLAPEGELGVYFDAAGTQLGQIVDTGGTFNLYVLAKNLPQYIRGLEFALPNLTHSAIELLSVDWGPTVTSPQITSGAEFMVIFSGCVAPSSPLLIATLECRMNSWVGALGFEPSPLAAPSFGTPTLPGVPGWLSCEPGAPKRPFAEFATASINPFPLAVYWGLEHQALGSAALLPQGETVVLSGLGSLSGGGARAYFDAARPPGSKTTFNTPISPDGVDGAGFGFEAPLPAANLPEGATLQLRWDDDSFLPLVSYDAVVANGWWSVQADMGGVSSPTLSLEAINAEQTVYQDAAFGGQWLSEMVLPEAIAVLYDQGEFVLGEFWGSPIDVVIGGNQVQVDQLLLRSQTGAAIPPLSVASAEIFGSLLPDITLKVEALQRFGYVYSNSGNVILSSENEGLRMILQDVQSPGTTNVEALGDAAVGVVTAAPPASDISARVTMRFLGRGDPNQGSLDWTLQRMGSGTELSLDLSGVGTSDWLARGYLSGNIQWEYGGNGPNVGTATTWPSRSTMGQSGLEIEWVYPIDLTQAVPKDNVKRLTSIDRLEILPQQAQQPLPNGAAVELSFSGTSEIDFTEMPTATDREPVTPDLSSVLYPNVPNPFNPRTTIQYQVAAEGGRVNLDIYDARGRLVRTLVDSWESGGEKQVTWDGRDTNGILMNSGVYYYRLRAPGADESRKMVLLK